MARQLGAAQVWAAPVLRADLKAAGIAYRTEEGFADFHALRHSFITAMGRADVPLTTAQRLARHSDPKLTARRYTHLGLMDLAGAVPALPGSTTVVPVVAPLVAPAVAQTGATSGTPWQSGDTEAGRAEQRNRQGKDSVPSENAGGSEEAGEGIRTLDSRHGKPVLYH